jgi:predicted DNA-binding transcriptional regulator AlpA
MLPDFTAPEQNVFDKVYISSKEMCDRLNVARSSLMHAYRRGTIPYPIQVNEGLVMLWVRETVEPFLVAWEHSLAEKRGNGK